MVLLLIVVVVVRRVIHLEVLARIVGKIGVRIIRFFPCLVAEILTEMLIFPHFSQYQSTMNSLGSVLGDYPGSSTSKSGRQRDVPNPSFSPIVAEGPQPRTVSPVDAGVSALDHESPSQVESDDGRVTPQKCKRSEDSLIRGNLKETHLDPNIYTQKR